MRKKIEKAVLFLLMVLFASAPLPVAAKATKTSIKVAVNGNLPPFQFLDKEGNIVGLHIDIMNEIAAREDLIVEYMVFNENSEAVEALENGLVDVILGALSNNETSSKLQRTNDISSASVCMLVRNSDISLVLNPQPNQPRYIAAFELGTISLSQLSHMNIMYTLIMGNQVQLFNSLIEKKVDAVIGVKESMLYQLEQARLNNSYTIVHNYIGSVDYSMLVRRNDRVLLNSLNSSISWLRASKTYETLLDKWIVNTEKEAAQELIKKVLSFIAVLICIVLIVFCNIAYMNYRLKKTVEEKTKEIRSRVRQLEYEGVLRDRLIECSPSGIILLKADGHILMMNSVARAMAGIKQNEDVQKNCNIRNLNILGEIWEHMASQNITTTERPSVVKLGSNKPNSRIFRYQCHSINEDNDKVLMVEDITREEEEKQESFELRKSKSLSRVIAGMAHEIKNPLMSISTFASLIKQQGNDADFQALFAQHVPKEVERINRLIELLINYARPSRSRKERISVRDIIDDSAYFAHLSIKDKRIKFQVDADIKAYIYVNRDQIRQSLVNLVMNSIQSVEEKLEANGTAYDILMIRVSGYRRDGQICLEVYDEGCGMTESELEKCMEPFFTTKASGLGMGLALTRQFVYENSGKLEFESSKNEFTTIRMIFEEDMTQ